MRTYPPRFIRTMRIIGWSLLLMYLAFLVYNIHRSEWRSAIFSVVGVMIATYFITKPYTVREE
jgi:ABC-type sulfate transport system permease subunit